MVSLESGPDSRPAFAASKDVYDDQFVAQLGADFGFDPNDVGILSDLYEIAFRYRVARRMEGEVDIRKDERRRLIKLQKTFRKFLDELEANGGAYFNLEVHDGARMSGDLDPDLDPANYPGQKLSKNGCYWFEFERYLKFFDLGLEATINRIKQPGGRPKNEGLWNAIRYIEDFWTDRLDREFTLGYYHEGMGLSDAFKFAKRLLEPLDAIPDEQVVTAMRGWIKQTNEWKAPNADDMDAFIAKITHRNL